MADELRKEKLAKLREKRKASEVGENNDVEILNNTEGNVDINFISLFLFIYLLYYFFIVINVKLYKFNNI